MAARKFSAIDISENEWNQVMVGAVGTDSTVTISVVNHSEIEGVFDLALMSKNATVVENKDVFVLGQVVEAGKYQLVKGVPVEAENVLVVRSNVAGMTCLVYGFDEHGQS